MTKIILTQSRLKEVLRYNPETGKFTWLVNCGKNRNCGKIAGDNKDYDYSSIRIDNILYRAPRLVFLYMTGNFPDQVDHINHHRNDDRWFNLREVSSRENNMNLSLRKTNKSGCIGVNWRPERSCWRSRIGANDKQYVLYSGIDFFEACCRRKSAEANLGFHENHGE